jgi:Tfp pilus assembly protein PilX
MRNARVKASSYRLWQILLFPVVVLAAALVVTSCNSGSMNTASGMGTVSVMVSDPATCQAPAGPFSHVFVTITDLQVNVSSTASATDSGWVDLTPNLSKNPKQVDLLGLANSQCFLADLGDSLELQAGTYQQIRVILASNSATLPTSVSNACSTASANNCVVLNSDSSVHALQLSSEAQTGIKIPGSQINSGGFTIASGQTKELDINFLTCESIVQEGNGQFRLKPVLHAGEVSAASTSINGTVLDSVTGKAINGTAYVAVEQPDSNKIDRIQMYQKVNADGTFVFCPLPAGTYDVVVVGADSSGDLYQPSIVTGVSVGSTTGNIKLYLPTTATTPTLTNSSAVLSGEVTSQNGAGTPAGTVADVQLSALETVNSVVYTIPLPPTSKQSSATLSVETAAAVSPATCPPGVGTPAGTTDCVNYSLTVPSGAAYWGAWSASGTTLNAPPTTALLANYSVDGIASLSGAPDCSVSEIKNPTATTALSSTVPYAMTALNLNFQGCQ